MRKDLERLESAQNSIRAAAPYDVSNAYTIPHSMVTTAFNLDGYRIVRTLGVVRGITVRSRSLIGNIGASLQTLVGGNITILTRLCEETRAEAFDIMVLHGSQIGANAIVGVRYDATEIMQGATEVLAYGTAVVVEPAAASVTDAPEPRIP
jgi:uncharacterized protein YbjQ (UPF0145 family)